MTLSERLKEAIRSAPTVYSVAKASGVSQPQLAHFLRGSRDIRLVTADKLAEWAGLELTPKAANGGAVRDAWQALRFFGLELQPKAAKPGKIPAKAGSRTPRPPARSRTLRPPPR